MSNKRGIICYRRLTHTVLATVIGCGFSASVMAQNVASDNYPLPRDANSTGQTTLLTLPDSPYLTRRTQHAQNADANGLTPVDELADNGDAKAKPFVAEPHYLIPTPVQKDTQTSQAAPALAPDATSAAIVLTPPASMTQAAEGQNASRHTVIASTPKKAVQTAQAVIPAPVVVQTSATAAPVAAAAPVAVIVPAAPAPSYALVAGLPKQGGQTEQGATAPTGVIAQGIAPLQSVPVRESGLFAEAPHITPAPALAPIPAPVMNAANADPKALAMLAPAAGSAPVTTTPEQVTTTPAPVLLQVPPTLSPQSTAHSSVLIPIVAQPPLAQTPLTPGMTPLSDQSKHIVNTLPPEKNVQTAQKPLVEVDRFRKNVMEESDVVQHEGVGIKISVQRPKADVNHMLEMAYDALIAGNQEEAVDLYKEVLDRQPTNKLALFGLATTYHRAGQIQLARPLYGKLLAIDPTNKEGLNNFLVLLADESPNEALVELNKLQLTHPGFSPVPAQMAIIYEKMGDYPRATQAMNHAMQLSPENLKYQYDMAIILDKQGDWVDAATLYQQLITAEERGEKIPANPEEIQERLTFIRSNGTKG